MKIKIKHTRAVKLEDVQAGEIFRFVNPIMRAAGDERGYFLMTDHSEDATSDVNDYVKLSNGEAFYPEPEDPKRKVYVYPQAYLVIPKDEHE